MCLRVTFSATFHIGTERTNSEKRQSIIDVQNETRANVRFFLANIGTPFNCRVYLCISMAIAQSYMKANLIYLDHDAHGFRK